MFYNDNRMNINCYKKKNNNNKDINKNDEYK